MADTKKKSARGKRRALGKGLNALIRADMPAPGRPEPQHSPDGGMMALRPADVKPNPYQPRHGMDESALEDLISSVKEYGVVQPIVVRRTADGHEVIMGHRRLEAARAAGLDKVPAIVREVTDEQMLCLAIVENVQREDLNPIDKADAYKRLIDEFGMTQEEVAERVGQNRATVANTIRLLALPQSIRVVVAKGDITTGHAKALLSLETARQQEELCRVIIKRELSVRATEKTAAKMRRTPVEKQRHVKKKDVHIEAIEEQLRGVFGTRVNVAYAHGKGKIEIEYYNDGDLERILSLLRQ